VSERNQPSQRIHRKQVTRLSGLLIFGIVLALAAMHARAQGPASKSSSKIQAAPTGNNDAGKKIYESRRCVGCHQADARGSASTGAPRIGPPRTSLADFVKLVRNPVGTMPPVSAAAVSDAELAQVYVYLQSFPARPQAESTAAAGNAENGALLFARDGCYECHGREGQGSRQTSAPRIGPPALPFAEFAKYVRRPRGSMPPYTGKVISDSEMADIFAFLESLPNPPPADSIPLLSQ
jgi:mono/diheme cytochrome c family protein